MSKTDTCLRKKGKNDGQPPKMFGVCARNAVVKQEKMERKKETDSDGEWDVLRNTDTVRRGH